MEIFLNQPYSFYQLGKRGNQEDARFPDQDMPSDYSGVYVVCDGVGGEKKGEVASSTVADAIGNYMKDVDLSEPFTEEDFSKVLRHAYNALDKKATPATKGMSTTLTFVCINEGGVFCAHIGDSRIYQIRPGVGIMYRSEDHSLVNALVHSGNITPEEAEDHPMSNVITRCMTAGAKEPDKFDATTVQITDVDAGDYFFLCTDGVLHNLDDSDLLKILSGDGSDREKIDEIANRSRNSSDNNTAFLIPIGEVSETEIEFEPAEEEGGPTRPLNIQGEYTRDTAPASCNGWIERLKNFFG